MMRGINMKGDRVHCRQQGRSKLHETERPETWETGAVGSASFSTGLRCDACSLLMSPKYGMVA